MFKRTTSLVIASLCGIARLAHASGGEVHYPLQFYIDFDLVSAGSVRPDGGTWSTPSVSTAPDEGILQIRWNKISVYLAPFTDQNSYVGAGYHVSPEWELGANIELESLWGAGANPATNSLGGWLWYYRGTGRLRSETGGLVTQQYTSDGLVRTDVALNQIVLYGLARDVQFFAALDIGRGVNAQLSPSDSRGDVYWDVVPAGLRVSWGHRDRPMMAAVPTPP
jgi:hypothetical protein